MNARTTRRQTDSHGHAVVIGASVAGLLAARVLSETFDQVTLFERDELPAQIAPRKGVPQSRQQHVLLTRGADALDELFPGFTSELTKRAAPPADVQSEVRWYLDGHRMHPATSGLLAYGTSRPLIEHLIRSRVTSHHNVTIRQKTAIQAVLTDNERNRAAGVRILPQEQGAEESEVTADLVIDASGRASRAHVWLKELGYTEPPETRIPANVVYVTRHYRFDPELNDGYAGASILSYPGRPRGGVLSREEDGRWTVALSGLLGEEPPTDDAGMLAYAHSLAGPDVAEVIRSAILLDEAVKMRYPASLRRHYEKASRHLDNFLVMGDALCSLNPTYAEPVKSNKTV